MHRDHVGRPFNPSRSLVVTSSRLVRNRELLSRSALILSTDEVGDLLVLGLFDGRFVVLLALTESILLDCIDTYENVQSVDNSVRFRQSLCNC